MLVKVSITPETSSSDASASIHRTRSRQSDSDANITQGRATHQLCNFTKKQNFRSHRTEVYTDQQELQLHQTILAMRTRVAYCRSTATECLLHLEFIYLGLSTGLTAPSRRFILVVNIPCPVRAVLPVSKCQDSGQMTCSEEPVHRIGARKQLQEAIRLDFLPTTCLMQMAQGQMMLIIR